MWMHTRAVQSIKSSIVKICLVTHLHGSQITVICNVGGTHFSLLCLFYFMVIWVGVPLRLLFDQTPTWTETEKYNLQTQTLLHRKYFGEFSAKSWNIKAITTTAVRVCVCCKHKENIFVSNVWVCFFVFLHILLHHTSAAVVGRSHHVKFHVWLEELAQRIINFISSNWISFFFYYLCI